MMVKKSFAVLLTGVLLIAGAQARTFVLADVQPPGHPLIQAEERLASRLAEISQGALQIQLKPGGQEGGEADTWAKVKAGTLDMARVNLAQLASELPAARLMSLPYLFRSREHMWRVLDGDFGARLKREAEQAGAVVVGYYDSGTRSFYNTRKPIRTAADFAGLRIRVQDSPVHKDMISLLGATPVVLPYDKVAGALQKGEIDGAENNLPSYVSSGHYKLAKYFSMDEHSSTPEVLLMSKQIWASLNATQKKMLLAAAADSTEFMRKQWAESEAQALAKARKEGVSITEKDKISLSGIEGYALKVYTKYVTNKTDLDTVLAILKTK